MFAKSPDQLVDIARDVVLRLGVELVVQGGDDGLGRCPFLQGAQCRERRGIDVVRVARQRVEDKAGVGNRQFTQTFGVLHSDARGGGVQQLVHSAFYGQI